MTIENIEITALPAIELIEVEEILEIELTTLPIDPDDGEPLPKAA